MSMSMKYLFINQNNPLSNSVVLNNYTSRNVIISPTKMVTRVRNPTKTSHYFIPKKTSYSPSPEKFELKKSTTNQDNIKKILILKNYTPLTTCKSASRIDCLKLKQNTDININNSQNLDLDFPQLLKKEKVPQDSARKIKPSQKKKIIIRTANKLKNSVSQRVFQTFKKPNAILNKMAISQEITNKNLFMENNKVKNFTNIKEKAISNLKRLFEPTGVLNLNEFQLAEQLGKGTFGKIFCVKWNKNNKLYALKKEILTDLDSINRRRNSGKIIQNFIKNTKSKGMINLYSTLLIKNNIDSEYQYYELMEKAERDWDQEINLRSHFGIKYKEQEIIDIMKQLIHTLALLQKNHITHRDLKPQNILVVNGKYKLCDYGEIRLLKRDGFIVQRVRGSELYMSPILFYGLHHNLVQVKHNTYKSDVFSLGMCFFYASSLTYNGVDSIRELTNMQKIKEILFNHLNQRYSLKYMQFILEMLELNENKRPDFIQLELKMKKLFP